MRVCVARRCVGRGRSLALAWRLRYFVADRDLVAVALGGIGGFFAGLAGADDAAVGIEFVGGLGDAVEIEIGGDLNARMARTDHRVDDRLDLFAQPVLEGDLPLVGAESPAVGIVAGAVGQQVAGLVDDRDALRPQAVDGGGDEMADGAHLRRLERAAHAQHDRRRRLDLVAREQRAFGHDQMHAGILDAVERADGARELAFERAHGIDVLHEARGAERVGFVENLVADAAALGQAALGQRHAQPRDPVARHQDDVAVVRAIS